MEFINNILINVVVLDSRYKLEYVSFYFSDVYGVGVNNEKVSEIKSLLFCLYVFYCTLLLGGGQPSKGVAISSVIVVPNGNNDHYQSARLARVAQMREHKEIVDRYLLDSTENIESEEKFNMLNWWRVNSTRYHVFSLFDREVFDVQISTVASESLICAHS